MTLTQDIQTLTNAINDLIALRTALQADLQPAPVPTPAPTPSPVTAGSKYVMINLLTWKNAVTIDYTKIREVSIFNFNPDSQGNLTEDTNTFTAFTETVTTAHSNNAKCTVAVGGSGVPESNIQAIIANPSNFVNQCVALVKKYGFDGIQLDFETSSSGGFDPVGYGKLTNLLYTALHGIGAYLSITYADFEKSSINISLLSYDFLLYMAYPANITTDMLLQNVNAVNTIVGNPYKLAVGFNFSNLTVAMLSNYLQAVHQAGYSVFFWNADIATSAIYQVINQVLI